MVTPRLAVGLLVSVLGFSTGCDDRSDPPPTPAPSPMQPLPQMPVPVVPAPVAVQPIAAQSMDPRTQWDEQRIARLEQQVTVLSQENQSMRAQLAETQEAVRRIQGQAGAARRTLQGLRNQYQPQ